MTLLALHPLLTCLCANLRNASASANTVASAPTMLLALSLTTLSTLSTSTPLEVASTPYEPAAATHEPPGSRARRQQRQERQLHTFEQQALPRGGRARARGRKGRGQLAVPSDEDRDARRGRRQAKAVSGRGGGGGGGGRGGGRGRAGLSSLPPLPAHIDAKARALLLRTRREASFDPSARQVLRGWEEQRSSGVEGAIVRAAGASSPGADNPYRGKPLPHAACEGLSGVRALDGLSAPLFMAAASVESLAAAKAPFGLQMGGKTREQMAAAIARYQANTSQPLACRFRTCAVVGSSGNLRGGGLGRLIDAHDAVIRINAAPVSSQHEAAVGRRTTWRVHNSEKPYFLAALGVPELQLLICHMGWIGSCQHQAFSGAYVESTAYVNPALYGELWEVLGRPADKQSPSTGLLAIALGLGACGHVSLFGFGAAGAGGESRCLHYWECGRHRTEASYYDPMHSFHDWLAEEVLRNRWIEAGLVTDGRLLLNATAATDASAGGAGAAGATAGATGTNEAAEEAAAEEAARAAVAALPPRDDAATRAAWAAMLPAWRRERRALFDERRRAKARGAREGGAKHLAWGDEGAHGGGRAQTTQDVLRRHGLG